MNNSNNKHDFILNTINKMYDFALKNNFKKEINKHLPRDRQLKNHWKIDFLNNYISYSGKKPLDICLESDIFDQREKEFINAVKNGFVASYGILSNENDLCIYNFINEKEYSVALINPKSLNPSLNRYFISRLIEFEGNYYIPDIVDILEERRNAVSFAKDLLLGESTLIYKDNPQKEEEVTNFLDKIYSEFTAIFGNEEILLSADTASDIADTFVNFIKDNDINKREEVVKLFQEQVNEEMPFGKDEKSDEESKDKENFEDETNSDNSLFFVLKDKGLYVARYYNILKNIYGRSSFSHIYTEIEKAILSDYFFEEKFEYPAEAILKLYEEADDKEKFLKTTRTIIRIISEDYDFDEFPNLSSLSLQKILDNFKPDYYSTEKQFSFYTLHIVSKSVEEIFNETQELIQKIAELRQKLEEYEEDIQDHLSQELGKNEPCYCGSGKKYKKCCWFKL